MESQRPPSAHPQQEQRLVQAGCLNWLLWLTFVFLLFNWLLPSFRGSSPANETVSYSTFLEQIRANNVQKVSISDYTVTGVFKTAVRTPDGTTKSTHFTTTVPLFGNTDLIALLETHHVAIDVQPSSSSSSTFWLNILLFAGPLLVLLLAFFWWMSRRMTSTPSGLFSFGKSTARRYTGGKTQTTFADVAGVEEARAELVEIVAFLKDPSRFQRLGGKIPRGILLVGTPGTGKTLLARAVAGEADVPFFSISASEFVEMLVGVGASRVRDLFATAKKNTPCILFIDELDAVGRERGAGLGGGSDEREQTLNQVLVEMDGFDPHEVVIVLAATNRPDVLDPALLRPGRFDRQIAIDRPDRAGREAILRVHVRNVPLAPDVQLKSIAGSTVGMVGADLANLVNEAALIAARRNLEQVTQACFEDALDRILMGAERPLVLSPEERQVTAYHESGHALVAMLTPGADPVHKVTIVPRGQALGATKMVPIDDRHNYPRSYLLARLAVGLGGRVAEELTMGEITTGAENDLQEVSRLAREMVTRWGMSPRLGAVFLGGQPEVFLGREVGLRERQTYSEQTATLIDEEVQHLIGERYRCVHDLLAEHREELEHLAQALLEREVLDEPQLHRLVQDTQHHAETNRARTVGSPSTGIVNVFTKTEDTDEF
ncbi:MAG TPA: ATP-dependent zinc metalloprotease FtsH [Ktedonobacteraceae bacterium]|nr:ATP-dependent zinc metalloprotease FtsH [Ktedonobacteraceae bacterium]